LKLLGVTGGIGMGKSACAGLLRERGLPVVDTDDLARRVVEPGQPGLQEVVRAFGAEVLSPAGALRRDRLADIVFREPQARLRLEAILHPRIRALWHAEADAWRARGAALGVVVIPLLFETGAEKELDRVLCVACSAQSQMERLKARGWPSEQITRRIQAQWPVEKKISQSHYMVWTEGSLEAHGAQVAAVLRHFSSANL
jgi:dephospho-CoA kinase